MSKSEMANVKNIKDHLHIINSSLDKMNLSSEDPTYNLFQSFVIHEISDVVVRLWFYSMGRTGVNRSNEEWNVFVDRIYNDLDLAYSEYVNWGEDDE